MGSGLLLGKGVHFREQHRDANLEARANLVVHRGQHRPHRLPEYHSGDADTLRVLEDLVAGVRRLARGALCAFVQWIRSSAVIGIGEEHGGGDDDGDGNGGEMESAICIVTSAVISFTYSTIGLGLGIGKVIGMNSCYSHVHHDDICSSSITGHSEIPSIRVKKNLGTVVSKKGYVLNTTEAETLLSTTLIHEVMHVLGFDPHAFAHFRDERKRQHNQAAKRVHMENNSPRVGFLKSPSSKEDVNPDAYGNGFVTARTKLLWLWRSVGAIEFIICHSEVSIAFAEEKKIPEGQTQSFDLPIKKRMYTYRTFHSHILLIGSLRRYSYGMVLQLVSGVGKLNNMEKGLRHGEASPLLDIIVFDKQGLGGRVRHILSGATPLSAHVEGYLQVVTCAHVLQGYEDIIDIFMVLVLDYGLDVLSL
ncbi:hypothetical protein JHK85_010718 [Glycine max]|nr:hypothetical protein JHK85_010718 [Glycine max]